MPSVQFSSVAHSCLTLCDPMNCSMPGLPVHHQLLESTQTHVHRVSDAIQPSHPLSSPSPPAPNPSQHQGFFQWVNSSHEWPKYWSFSFSISPSNEHPGLISFRVRVRFLLFCLRNQNKKKAPIFWWELLSNFQLVKVQCWLPFISQDVWDKDQHRWFKWKACLQKVSLSAACPWGSISSGVQKSRWVSQFPDTVLLSTHPCRRSWLKR